MRKILVPTDFSGNAYNALRYACRIFKYERCEFYVLHAYADEVYRKFNTGERSQLDAAKADTMDASEKYLKEILPRIREDSPNPQHGFKTLSVFGALTDSINELVNAENIDIVLMGTQGETAERSLRFGSNTLHVLKYVQCPVLAIPAGFEFQAPKQILFPTNYLIPYKRRELKLLCEIADSYRATIHMLYIDPVSHLSLRQEDNMQFLKECLYKPKLRFETGPQEDKTSVILDYISRQGIQLLVMVNSRHSHVDEMLYRSTIDKLALELRIPFLVLQNLPR